MSHYVDITFDCLPLRSVSRFDIPLDAPPEYEALLARIRHAADKHGLHNSYYLYNARCVYHLTNDQDVGLLEFRFEGTMLTDPDDQHTRRCDLQVDLHRDTCDWITTPIVDWFAETTSRAVRIEFDRYISAGDLDRTIQRMEQLEAESDSQGGFVGMGL